MLPGSMSFIWGHWEQRRQSCLIPGAPLITITMFVQVVAVTLLARCLLFLMLLLNDEEMMGDHVNTRLQNIINWSIVAAVIAISTFVRGVDNVSGMVCLSDAMSPLKANTPTTPESYANGKDYRFYFFSELLKRPVCAGKIKNRIGKLSDLVFKLSEHYPEAVGIFLEFGWGKPTQFIPWDKVIKIEEDAIFVQPPQAECYPPFVDQAGWILLDEHLMGKTILDMDGRTIEVVNDVHLLESRGRMIIVHVDISFNGFLRKLGLREDSLDQRSVHFLEICAAAVVGRCHYC